MGNPAACRRPPPIKLVPDPKGKVILFFPHVFPWKTQYPVWAPNSMIAIGNALAHAGYEVVLIDERLDPEPRERLFAEMEDALFLGISGKLGGQARRMEDVVTLVKERNPDFPIVAGGWFPGLFPMQTIGSPHIDIVVVGPGDFAIVEVADRLLQGRSMAGIESVYYKDHGEIRTNPVGNLPRMENTHRIPWRQFRLHRYVHPHGWVNYFTSRGCPGGCTFCGVICLDPRRWTALPAERVVDEMEEIVHDVGAEALQIMDTDFCASRSRVEKVSRLLIARGVKCRFNILGRYFSVRRFTDEQLWLLRRAGCNEIEIGLETGSQRISDQINKQCRVDDFPQLVRRLVHFGIRVRVNIMLGFPSETRQDLADTFKKMLELRKLGHLAVRFQMFRFTPIPDAPDGRRILSLTTRGNVGQQDFTYEELLDFPVNENLESLFWLPAERERDVQIAYEFYAPLLFYKNALDTAKGRPIWRLFLVLFQKIAAWRVARGNYRMPIECWLNRVFGKRMPRGADEGISPAEDQLPALPEMGQALDTLPSLAAALPPQPECVASIAK